MKQPQPDTTLPRGPRVTTYTCSFKQTGTANPDPIELQNTTNDTTPWHRDYAGLYRKKISNSTIKDKCFISGNSNAAGDGMTVYPIADFSGHTIGFINIFPLEDAGKTYLMLETVDNTGNDVEYSTILGITTTWIELKIYQ